MIEALIVQTQRRGPGQMLGLGDGTLSPVTSFVDTLTGGEYSAARAQLDRLETLLQVSIAASVVAGVVAVVTLFFPSRR